ncbi:MAG TPA: ATP cone domain-containing protein, partial [Bacteroidales bacterium]|nr:ATP cone domain-containing protein [Bacteroidales bacterium]
METLNKIDKIIKRNGQLVEFNPEKITFAIYKAFRAIGRPDRQKAEKYGQQVVERLQASTNMKVPSVEEIQDLVERTLFDNGEFEAGKAYVIYRYQHQNIRQTKEL